MACSPRGARLVIELKYLIQVSVGQFARERACGVAYIYSAACGPRWMSARDMLSLERTVSTRFVSSSIRRASDH